MNILFDDTGERCRELSEHRIRDFVAVKPLHLGPILTIASPGLFAERVYTVCDVAKRTASCARQLADGVSQFSDDREISIVDRQNSFMHKAVTRALMCQIGGLGRHDSSPVP